jgi:hypothetical protein
MQTLPGNPVVSMPICLVMRKQRVTLVGSMRASGTCACTPTAQAGGMEGHAEAQNHACDKLLAYAAGGPSSQLTRVMRGGARVISLHTLLWWLQASHLHQSSCMEAGPLLMEASHCTPVSSSVQLMYIHHSSCYTRPCVQKRYKSAEKSPWGELRQLLSCFDCEVSAARRCCCLHALQLWPTFFCVMNTTQSLPRTAIEVTPHCLTALKAYSAVTQRQMQQVGYCMHLERHMLAR